MDGATYYLVKRIGVWLEKSLLDSSLLCTADLGVATDVLLTSEASATLMAQERFVFCKNKDDQ